MAQAEFEERGSHFVLKAGNGEVVGTSETYGETTSVSRAIDDFKVAALEAIAAELEEYESDSEAALCAQAMRKVADRYKGLAAA